MTASAPSLPHLLFDAIRQHDPTQPALITPHHVVTYGQWEELVTSRAALLVHRFDITPGTVVALQLPNGVDFPLWFHAVLLAGGIVTPVSMTATPDDLRYHLERTGARIVLDAVAVSEVTNDAAPAAEFPNLHPDDLACLPMSSGTTGLPKPVMLTHRNLMANTLQFSRVVPVRRGQRCLSVLPLSHIYGLTSLLHTPLLLGATVVLQPFEAESFITAHERHGVNTTFIAPPLATLLAQHPLVDSVDFSQLHTIVNGAAALNPKVGAAVAARLHTRVVQGYGMTEASPVTHIAQRDDTPLASIGQLLPDTHAKIIDPASGEIATEGELWISGPQVMAGYFHDTEATAATLVDGWLRTGDIVRRDGDDFYVIDRIKDIINSHGVSVSPVKVETIVAQCPGVSDCAVVRGYDATGEERPVAVVVGTATADEIMSCVNAQLSPAERIREVRFVDEIPRSSAGKIMRRALVQQRWPYSEQSR